MLKWVKRLVLGLVATVLLAVLVIWAASAWQLNKRYEPEDRPVVDIPTDAASIEEGARLAQLYGCARGCHGRDMEGDPELFEFPDGSMARSPNLVALLQDVGPKQMEISIRQGIKPNGRSVAAMPSASFATMSDDHLGKIMAYIGSVERQDNDIGTSRFMPAARLFILLGEFVPDAANMVPGRRPATAAELEDSMNHGKYLALNACAECHGLDLNGSGGFTPSLVAARAYSEEQFRALMREGEAVDDRDLGLMRDVAKSRFSQLTEKELDDLYGYLMTAELPLGDVPLR